MNAGEAIASSSRNHMVFFLCSLFLFRSSKVKDERGDRYSPRGVALTRADWRGFLRDGGALVVMHYAGSASRFITPILTSRLGRVALGARIITSHIASWPHIISTVLNTLVIVLGSKYLGAAKVQIYRRFVGRLLFLTAVVSMLAAAGFAVAANKAYEMYTDDEETVTYCRSCTVVLVVSFALSILGSVANGMVYAAREFRWLAVIQIWMLWEPTWFVMRGRQLKVSLRHTEVLVLLGIGLFVVIASQGSLFDFKGFKPD